jgi:hypothetical protein
MIVVGFCPIIVFNPPMSNTLPLTPSRPPEIDPTQRRFLNLTKVLVGGKTFEIRSQTEKLVSI